MQEELKSVRENIAAFRRKYYLNLTVRGGLLTASVLGGYFLLAALLEYAAWLSPSVRFLLFFLFFALSAFSIFYFLRSPLWWWLRGVGLSEDEAARLIGKNFPEVGDRLLNILQLARSARSNELAAAGISQKSSVVQKYSFASSVNLNVNRSHAKYLAFALLVFLSILIFNKNILTESAHRIIHFNQEYSPAAPFAFHLPPQDLRAYFNEDHAIHLRLSGTAVPEAAYLVLPNQRIKMEGGNGNFLHTFEKLQQPVSFQIEAAGYFSPSYKIEILHRPELLRINMVFYFPAYLRRPSASQSNAGAIAVPEGTRVSWNIETQHTSKAFISFGGGAPSLLRTSDNLFYNFEQSFKDPSRYSLSLFNRDSQLKDSVSYPIAVIKDAYPQLAARTQTDSVLFKNIFLGGVISDDYANTKLELIYTVSGDGKNGKEQKKPIGIFPNRPQQNFVFQWNLDSLGLKPNQQINYFLQVWDNDGINGPKAARSPSYIFNMPPAEEMRASIAKSEKAAKSAFEKSLEKTKTLKDAIKTAKEKIRSKRQLDWQDKKALTDLVKQKQDLDQQIQELQKQNELLEQKKADEAENERLKEKAEQLQQLMKELLDDETKELFKKLEELLQRNADPKSIQDVLKKLDHKEINLEKELERTMELFKQLQRDFKFEQSAHQLRENIKRQKDLMNETEKNEKGQSEKTEKELMQEQEKVKEDFKDFEKSLDQLRKTDGPKEDIPQEEKTDDVEKSMENSQKELENKKSGKSKPHQKEAIQKMEEMEKEMKEAQESMGMEMDEKNMESLKQILHGLINLSFSQEALAKAFGKVEQSDPAYLKLSEKQLDLKNDIAVLEDSLVSLAKKDAFMSAIVSRKVGDLNDHFDKAIQQIKERNQPAAASEMQFSMAAINDLALLLNEHFDMMMKMAAKPSRGKGKGKGKTPSLSQLQKKLNEQIEQLQKNGKMPGRQLSEELARMAAEQERIRHALEKMQEKLLKDGGKMPGGDIPSKMEQTELDLVNKKLTEETVRRQKEIVTRLLETENSIRERDEDQERKGETAKKYNALIPKSFEEYFKLKEKEIELIKTLPPKLQPFYKNEVNKYFERLGNK